MTFLTPTVLGIYLLAANLIAVLLTFMDINRARKGTWRIRESTLLFFAAIGGAFGEWLTMLMIRHKTKHLKFMLSLPLFFTAHVLLIGFYFIRFLQ